MLYVPCFLVCCSFIHSVSGQSSISVQFSSVTRSSSAADLANFASSFRFFIFIYYHYILPSQLAPIGCRLRKERTNSFHSYSLVCWHIILCIIDSMLWSFQTTSHTHTHKHVGTQYYQEWLHLNQLTEYEDDDVDADGWHLTPMWLHVDVLLCYTNTLYDWLWWWRWLQPSCGRVLEVNSIFYGNKHKVCFLDDCDN